MARIFSKSTVMALAGLAALAQLSVPQLTTNAVADELQVATEAAASEAPAAECTEAKCPACEAGTCTGDSCPLKATEATVATKSVTSAAAGEANLATPTHRQTKIIKANAEGLSSTKLNCFAMTRDGRILAGCGTSKENGEIRVFDSNGEYVETWSTPCMVEAVNVRADDGMVFVAGNGILAKFDSAGTLVSEQPSPHVTLDDEQIAKMREAVIAQLTDRVKMYRAQAGIYDQQIKLIGEQLEKQNTELGELDGENAEESTDEESTAAKTRKAIEQRIAQLERSKTSLERTKKLWNERIEQLGSAEPSEEDIQRQIEAQISRKSAVASISAVGDTVYIACSSSVGYGYSVWAIDDEFAKGEEVVGDLRGCCGQMDVQVNQSGIYVAENARDRVVCFDHEGEEITHWGHSAREGIRGFGSCCNPMNVAFGPNKTVYTAESGTGRIKQYSSDGELLQVVGSADLVPGCKKVSIGVSSDGSRVFMLDITRDHIVMMDAIPSGERQQMVAKTAAGESEAPADESDAQAAVDSAGEPQARSTSATSTLMRALVSPFVVGD